MKSTRLLILLSTSTALIAGCSSSKSTAGDSTPPAAGVTSAPPSSSAVPNSPPASSTAAPPSSAPASSTVPPAGLSGTWQGRYGGAYTGTFVLQWKQATSKLTGTIRLSTAPGPIPINGTVAGGRIQFGTVGSQAITYTGSVSGASMQGRYQIAGGRGGSGSWSATRR